jgi:Holliday junction resolvase RusA-like endonuclease
MQNNKENKWWYSSRQKAQPMLYFTYKGEPLTKSNQTFFARRHAYIPKKQQDYQKGLTEVAKKAIKKVKKQKTSNLVMLEVWYYVGSKRRKDLPNLPKTTTDALNQVLYEDDFQIHDMIIHRRIDRENPRIEVAIWKVKDKQWEGD